MRSMARLLRELADYWTRIYVPGPERRVLCIRIILFVRGMRNIAPASPNRCPCRGNNNTSRYKIRPRGGVYGLCWRAAEKH